MCCPLYIFHLHSPSQYETLRRLPHLRAYDDVSDGRVGPCGCGTRHPRAKPSLARATRHAVPRRGGFPLSYYHHAVHDVAWYSWGRRDYVIKGFYIVKFSGGKGTNDGWTVCKISLERWWLKIWRLIEKMKMLREFQIQIGIRAEKIYRVIAFVVFNKSGFTWICQSSSTVFCSSLQWSQRSTGGFHWSIFLNDIALKS